MSCKHVFISLKVRTRVQQHLAGAEILVVVETIGDSVSVSSAPYKRLIIDI